MMKSQAEMQKDCKKIRHTSGGTILYQHVQPYFVLDEELCRGVVKRGPATTPTTS